MLLKRTVHYAWVIVAIAAAMGFITSAVRFAAAALVPHLSDPAAGFGWSYGAISLAFSLNWVVLGLVSPYVGWLGDRYGVRSLLLVGAFLFIAGMMLTGIMSSLWQFYLFFGVILGVATTIFTVLTVSGVTLWFRRHLGIAMGVVWSFQGAGTIALLFLIGVAFNQLGMKWIFWLPGIGGGAILLLLVRFFYNGPGEIGLRPLGDLGDGPIQERQKDEAAKIRAKVFIQQAKRTTTFWNLIGIHYWGCMGHNIINVLVVAIAVDRGMSLGLAAGVLAAQQGVGVIARGVVAGRSGAVGLPDGVGGRHGPSVFPLGAAFLFPGRLGFLPVRDPPSVSARAAKCRHSRLRTASITGTFRRGASMAGRTWATDLAWGWRPCAPGSCGT